MSGAENGAGKAVFLVLGLVVGAASGGGITWVVGSSVRSRLERQAEVEAANTYDANRRALIERGWRSVRAEPMSSAEMSAALEQCERDVRDLPERVGRERARAADDRTPARASERQ